MRKRWLWVAALSAAAVAFVLVGPPGGTPSRAAPSGDGPVSAPQSRVTLITGDRVSVRTVGGRTALNVEPARRAQPVPFQDFTRDGDSYLVPADAAGMIQSGLLDRELFNITGLVRQGYDDAHAPATPLLVQYVDGAAANRAAPPAGSTVRRTLPDFGIAALDAQKADTVQFWSGLVAGRQTRATSVRKVWLNARMHANLDESVPQISAPAAWESGLTGRGVRVAVLDTGIDTDHPDLAGKVDVSKDFSGKGSVEDGNGHGTHVASTIVGSGAASEGRYKGVAPDATLAVGKVLDDGGNATFDAVIAGMEWAAETGAKVVNMSLGGVPGSDGTDPVSAAANTLTREHGTLFVVSAGNNGVDESVGSPAAADAALAVASVSKQDSLSPFSSRGPRGGDGAVKPEIAAPGGGIVAARPAGVEPIGEPVGDGYQRLDGTSMAAPHVAGSAAILAQQHPDWTPDLLKDALVSSAVPIEGAGPFGVGAGRVDVARATGTSVVATGDVSAFLPWPNEGAQKKQTVTWHNSGAEPVTLDLRADLADTPDGLLTMSASSVTVPAGASASVEVTVTAQAGKAGTYAGVLIASTADGAITTRTALSVRQEEELFDLSVSAIDRDGNTAPDERAPVTVINLDTGDIWFGGQETYRLPGGRYAVNSDIRTPQQGTELSYSFISNPEFVLDGDTTQVLDARTGVRFSAEPDNAAASGGTQSIEGLNKVRDCACTFGFFLDVDPRFHEVYAATVSGTRSDGFAMGLERRATEPTLGLTANDDQPFDVEADWLEQGPAENLTLPVAYGGAGTPEDLAKIDATGRLVVVEFPAGIGRDEWFRRVDNIKAAGGKLAMLRFLDDASSLAHADDEQPSEFALPTMYGQPGSVTAERFATYARTAGATASYASRPFTDLRYELAYGVEGQITTPQVHRPKTSDLAEVRTAYHDNAPGEVRPWAGWQFFGTTVGSIYLQPAAAGQVRKEYFTPGTWDLSWSSAWRGELSDTREFAAGRRYEIAWNKAVASPSLRGLTQTYIGEEPRPWAWRRDDVLDLSLPMYGDAAGRPRQLSSSDGVTGSISLYRGDTLVWTVADPTRATIPVPAEEGAYRLVAESHRAEDIWPLWTTISAEWTFRSSTAGDRKALPLLTARFDPDVDVRNQAPGGRTFTFPAYVERQDGAAKVKALTVEVSYDDGDTWQPATVWRGGGHWTVRVRHPVTGYASLRATATDTDGNTVRQTVLRAYQIGK